MASWALSGLPAAVGPMTVMSAAAANKGKKKEGPFDWLTGVLDKPSLTEMDPILRGEDATPPPRPSAAPKKASPPKKQGRGGFFGLGKK